MRRSDRYPHTPPRHYVTPSESRYDYEHRHRPMVYQVYGHHHMPEVANSGFPGGFSPVRTSRSLRNHVSPPSASRPPCDDSLYASFSPPRHSTPSRHGSGNNSSIFRPRQSVIVARDTGSSSRHDDRYSSSTESMKVPAATLSSKEPGSLARNQVSSFPAKLHQILSSPEYQDIICFLPHGRAWRVLKPKVFEENVIPKFFRSSKYASFMRQVNGWGFKRVIQGTDQGAYYHPNFLRGLPHLCETMKRPVANETKRSDASESEQEPDFYKISQEHPLPDEGSDSSDQSSISKVVSNGHATAASPVITAQDMDEMTDDQLYSLYRTVKFEYERRMMKHDSKRAADSYYMGVHA